MYQSSNFIQEFCRRTIATASSLVGEDFEIILVNDGSPDSSLQAAINVAETDSRVVVIDLTRNFGHHPAMMAGLSESRGDLVFLVDIDLEEQPEWLTTFAHRMKQENCDVVFGIQIQLSLATEQTP